MTEGTHHTPEVITLPREMVVNDSLAGMIVKRTELLHCREEGLSPL